MKNIFVNILPLVLFLCYCLQAKKDGHRALREVRRFGLESLYSQFFRDKTYSGTCQHQHACI